MRPISPFAEHPEVQEVFVFYELLCFFLHLMNRQAFKTLGPERREKLQEEVGSVIVPTAIDTFCGHWPDELRLRLRRSFYEKLNDAEVEYASCKLLFPKKEPYDEISACSRLAINILGSAGYDADVQSVQGDSMELMSFVGVLVKDTLTIGDLKNFGELVENADTAIKQLNENVDPEMRREMEADVNRLMGEFLRQQCK